jgi:hypothetical protein
MSASSEKFLGTAHRAAEASTCPYRTRHGIPPSTRMLCVSKSFVVTQSVFFQVHQFEASHAAHLDASSLRIFSSLRTVHWCAANQSCKLSAPGAQAAVERLCHGDVNQVQTEMYACQHRMNARCEG